MITWGIVSAVIVLVLLAFIVRTALELRRESADALGGREGLVADELPVTLADLFGRGLDGGEFVLGETDRNDLAARVVTRRAAGPGRHRVNISVYGPGRTDPIYSSTENLGFGLRDATSTYTISP